MANIVLVDDDLSILSALESILILEGHQVHAVSTGEDALTTLWALPAPPQLLITDIGLPGISGLQVIEGLRADPVRQHVPCLAITANDTTAVQDRLSLMGNVSLLRKPFEADDLLNAVAAILN